MNKPVIQTKQSRKKFDTQFKQHAVELWLNSGRAATEVAAELGIHAQRLSAGGASRPRPQLVINHIIGRSFSGTTRCLLPCSTSCASPAKW